MSFVVTKLITTEENIKFFLLGNFTDMKQAAAVATEEYKKYNKAASFINLEMVNEWLSTRGEYSFRQNSHNRIQLDISQVADNEVVVPEHQVIFTHDKQEKAMLDINKALCPDGVSTAVK